MPDTRGRRDAEKRARELLSGKVAFIGDVGQAAAERVAAQEGVQAARERARELIEQARREGDRLIEQARSRVSDADAGYAEAFRRAVQEGWSAAMLTAMGYAAPPRPARRVAQSSTPDDAVRAVPAVPAQRPVEPVVDEQMREATAA
ncbi:hypothetical protein [Micromonospora sp. CPCC 206061]|uniref:hypothetical protein n=1 Tax=Micromonospora sp. CPCC 206061 TaxID=3122410 RepID=UPI002FF3E1BE